ncbi:MAG: DUF418 domain-containing protein [Chloroflexota bacterium]|nr:DUF418 domain-containing protein [Chloroflexota bacterium]
MASVTSQVTSSGSRIASLDLLRGIAILGTLGTNIWVFSAAGTPLDQAFFGNQLTVQSLFEVFANGKFLSLLAILGGVGVAIQYDSAQRKGQVWPGRYLWRSTLLFLEGLLHFTILFEGDVLMGYAVAAVITAFTLRRGERAVRWAIGVAGVLHLLFLALVIAGSGVLPTGNGEPEPLTIYAQLLLDGSYPEQVAFRISNALVLRAEPLFALPYTVFLFCAGAWLHQRGAFTLHESSRKLQRTMLMWGLGLGLPLNLLILAPDVWPELGLYGETVIFFAVRYGFSAVLALGYAGLVLWLLRRNAHGWLYARLMAVGRVALSTYVSQSVILSILFYGWGLGLGSQLADWTIALLFIALCIVQIVVAELWIRTGGGPLERIRKRLEKLGQRVGE